MSHVIVWEFTIREGHEREFEETYGSKGAWAALFAKSPDHLGVELLRDAANPSRFLTIDRWNTAESFRRFRETHAAEYDALDQRCECLTEREAKIGVWTVTA